MAEQSARSDNGERYCPVCGQQTAEKMCPVDGTRTVIKQKFSKDATAYEPGDLVNERYRITGVLGRGGFGAVYAAEHTGTRQSVALKMLTLDTSMDENSEHTQRFFQEARVTAQLTHINTVRVFDVGQAAEGPLFIAMEMLRGPSLAQYLTDLIERGEHMSEVATLDIVIPMLKSLGEAHKLGLVHRDIKPANVVLHQGADDDTIVKLLDFGIARAANSELTVSGRALGTPMYMSPEQCSGQQIDGRSDLYAVGILMFLCATGRLPFAGDDSMAVMFMQVNAELPDPRAMTSENLSDEFVAALRKAMQKDPEDRFRDARDMRMALEAVRGGAWAGTPTFGLDTATALRTVSMGRGHQDTDSDQTRVAMRRSSSQSATLPGEEEADALEEATVASKVITTRVKASSATDLSAALPSSTKAANAETAAASMPDLERASTQFVDVTGDLGKHPSGSLGGRSESAADEVAGGVPKAKLAVIVGAISVAVIALAVVLVPAQKQEPSARVAPAAPQPAEAPKTPSELAAEKARIQAKVFADLAEQAKSLDAKIELITKAIEHAPDSDSYKQTLLSLQAQRAAQIAKERAAAAPKAPGAQPQSGAGAAKKRPSRPKTVRPVTRRVVKRPRKTAPTPKPSPPKPSREVELAPAFAD